MKNWFVYIIESVIAITLIGILFTMLLSYRYIKDNPSNEKLYEVLNEITFSIENVSSEASEDLPPNEKSNDNKELYNNISMSDNSIEITDLWSNSIPSQAVFDLHFGGNEFYDTKSLLVEAPKDIENVLNESNISWGIVEDKYNTKYVLEANCELHIWFYHYDKHYSYSIRDLPKGSLLYVSNGNGYITYETSDYFANVANAQNIRIAVKKLK